MLTYKYKVKDKTGHTLDGITTGEDQKVVAERLRGMGYFILDIKQTEGSSSNKFNPFTLVAKYILNPLFGGVSIGKLALFYRQLAAMIKSGLTLQQAMNSLSSQGSGPLRTVSYEAAKHIQTGGKLSEAFARFPFIFPELHIKLIEAGETGGMLESILERIASYLEREQGIRQKLRIVTFYPKVLVLAAIFIPKLHLLLEGPREYLSATVGIFLFIIAIVAALWAGFRLLNQIPTFRYAIDMVKVSIPKLGKMIRALALSKFYRGLAAMTAAGVPLSKSIGHAADATGNWYLRTKLRTAIPLTAQGKGLTESLKSTRVLPHMAIDMLSTGEQTGNIDGMLDKAAEYTENEAEVSTYQSTVVVGVVLFLLIALYIMFIIIGAYQGQYEQIMDQPW